jgi:hypothetical protein
LALALLLAHHLTEQPRGRFLGPDNLQQGQALLDSLQFLVGLRSIRKVVSRVAI